MFLNESFYAALGILLSVITYFPYFLAIVKGNNRPHIFTWVIWIIVTGVTFAAQLSKDAGPGTWVTGTACFFCVIISLASLRKGQKDITRSDWILFIGALSAIPVWIFTSDPLWAVVIATSINVLAFYPTIRKTWLNPFEEHVSVYALNIPRQSLTIAALSEHTVTTVLFSASAITMGCVMTAMILYRRSKTKKSSSPV